jgi:hypothetical protein
MLRSGAAMTGRSQWRWWALRAILLFGLVYALGVLGVPTLVPYLTVLILVAVDARRVAARGR